MTVMVVDDDNSVRALLRFALPLGEVPVKVIGEAADGNEAIKVAERIHPDLIILDHMMPRRTGAAALPDLRRVSPNSDVLFFSAYIDAVESGEPLRRAAKQYEIEAVQKGSITELEFAVARVAHRRVA